MLTSKQIQELSEILGQLGTLLTQELSLWADKQQQSRPALGLRRSYSPNSDKGRLLEFLQSQPGKRWTNYTAAEGIGWKHPRTASAMNGLLRDGEVECVAVGARGIKTWKLTG